MKLSETSKMRFNGVDIKMAKLNGDIVYRKKEADPLLIAQYTASESGVVPTFNTEFTGYNVSETMVDGVYSVSIRTNTIDNTPTNILFDNRGNLLTVSYLKTDNVINMGNMFRDCSSLTSLDVSGWDTSKVTSMLYMFNGCNSLTSLDPSGFDTSNVTNMLGMFGGCTNLTSLNLSGFDTSNVTSMSYMFNNCNSLTSLDLSGFDTSNVTSMQNMFNKCENITSLDSMMNISVDLKLPSNLNQESILDVVNNLSTVSSTKTLSISATQLSWISADKIKEANNKGWTITA